MKLVTDASKPSLQRCSVLATHCNTDCDSRKRHEIGHNKQYGRLLGAGNCLLRELGSFAGLLAILLSNNVVEDRSRWIIGRPARLESAPIGFGRWDAL